MRAEEYAHLVVLWLRRPREVQRAVDLLAAAGVQTRHTGPGGTEGAVVDLRGPDAQISVFASRLTPEMINRISTARRKLTSLIRR
jgi:hypothetical protein